MPSTSKKQHNFMEAVAHNPAFAKKAGVPQSVGKDFSNADKGKTFKRGGDMAESKAMMKKGGMPMVMKDGKKIPAFAAKKGGMTKMARGGMTSAKMGKVPAGGFKGKGEHAIQKSGISKGTMIKMNKGGKAC